MLKLFTVLVIAGVSIGGANAVNPNPTSTTIITENSDNWVEVQNENGIKVYFSEFQQDGKTYLNIKFENNSSKNQDIKWSLFGGNTEVVINNFNSHIDANSEVEFYNPTLMIELKQGNTLSDFSIQINHN